MRTSSCGSIRGRAPRAARPSRDAPRPARRRRARGRFATPFEAVARVRELVRGGDHLRSSAASISRPLSGPTRARAVPGADRDRAPFAADAGIDHREVHADAAGTASGWRGRARPAVTACGGMPCVSRSSRASRRDPRDHAVTGADEVVLQPEVGQEGDRTVTLSPSSRVSRPQRRAHRGRGRGLAPRSRAPRSRDLGVGLAGRSRPPERVPPTPAYARAAEPEASTTTSPSGGVGREQARAVERDEVGAERVDRAAARALGGGEQHAARGTRELARAGRPATPRRRRRPARSRAREASRRCPGPTAATFGR